MKHATVMNVSNLLERYRMALWFCIEIACDDLCLLGYIRTLNLFHNDMKQKKQKTKHPNKRNLRQI